MHGRTILYALSLTLFLGGSVFLGIFWLKSSKNYNGFNQNFERRVNELPAVTLLKKNSNIPEPPTGTLKVGVKDTAISGVILSDKLVCLEGITVLLCPWEDRTERLELLLGSALHKGYRPWENRKEFFDEIGDRVKEIFSSRFRVTTGHDGSFAFTGMDPGLWKVIALSEELMPGMSRSLEVYKGRTAKIELVLSKGLGISGLVVDHEGLPVKNASVRARWSFKENLKAFKEVEDLSPDYILQLALGSMPRDDQSDPEGHFSFPSVTPGIYKLIAVKAGYTPSYPALVKIVEKSEDNVRLELQEGVSFTGKVKDKNGTPLAGAEVLVFFEGNTNALQLAMLNLQRPADDFSCRGTETNLDGDFKIAELREGTYAVIIKREEFQPGTFKGIKVSKQKIKPVEFVLQRGFPLYGKVVQRAGGQQPIENVHVVLKARFDPVNPVWPSFETFTDSKGNFHFSSLSLINYNLVAGCQGYVEFSRNIQSQDEPVVIKLIRGVSINGLVTSKQKPVPKAHIRLSFKPDKSTKEGKRAGKWIRPKIGITDQAGHFVLNDLSEGKAVINVFAQGYIELQKVVDITVGSTQPIKIELNRAGKIRGRIFNVSGKPVSEAKIRLIQISEDPKKTGSQRGPERRPRWGPWRNHALPGAVFSDKNGNWELPISASAEKAVILATHANYLPSKSEMLSLQDPSEDAPSVDLVLSEGSVLKGTVRDPSGKPLGGVRVEVKLAPKRMTNQKLFFGEEFSFPFRGGVSFSFNNDLSDAEGVWRISALKPGSYIVVVNHDEYAPYQARIELAEDEEIVHNINLEEASYIRGIVMAADGPIISAFVSAFGGGISRGVFSDQDGIFMLGGLVPGEVYRIGIRAPGFLPFKETDVQSPQEELLCRIVEPACLSGRVLSSGSLTPVRPFRVTLIPCEKMNYRWPGPQSFKTSDGSFVLLGIPPGTYKVRVESKTFPPAETHAFDLKEGEFREGLKIILDEGLTLPGSVKLPDGNPANGAKVEARPGKGIHERPGKGIHERPGKGIHERPRKGIHERPRKGMQQKNETQGVNMPMYQQKGKFAAERRWGPGMSQKNEPDNYMAPGISETGRDGRFKLKGLKPGIYYVQAKLDNWAPSKPKSITISDDGKYPNNIMLTLQKGLAVSGQLLLPGGLKGKNIPVILRGKGKIIFQRSDKNGRFRFQGLVAGNYSIEAVLSKTRHSKPVTVTLQKKDKTITISNW